MGRSRDVLHCILKVEPTEFLADRVQAKTATDKSSMALRLLA